MSKKETVFVGLSGGVDSSVAAKKLLDEGKRVVGVFIKTWQPDFLTCNWEAERLDAMRVAAHLGIPFYTCDAVDAYREQVAEYMIEEYRQGRTPNPDVLCNQYVKFGVFLEYAKANGADKVATGHYARVSEEDDTHKLKRGVDESKDQSYFLWALSEEQLSQTYFPVGNLTKAEVRKEAETIGLHTSTKKDSQGVCFLGDIDMQDFLSHYIKEKKGEVLDEGGNVIGEHDGVLFYTIGQRHGFTITAHTTEEKPHYVQSKDIPNNTITVATNPAQLEGDVVLGNTVLRADGLPERCFAQFRYRQTPFEVKLQKDREKIVLTVLDEKIEMPSLGQSCVLYNKDVCIGGGIITSINT